MPDCPDPMCFYLHHPKGHPHVTEKTKKDRFSDDEMRELLTSVLLSIRGGEVTDEIREKVERAIARRPQIEAEVDAEEDLPQKRLAMTVEIVEVAPGMGFYDINVRSLTSGEVLRDIDYAKNRVAHGVENLVVRMVENEL